MVPNNNLMMELENESTPSFTFALNKEEGTVRGYCDELDAMEQAIYCILNTERYRCPIYDWSYGVELGDLVGMPIDYCMTEVERRVKEALLEDDRIKEVHSFQFSNPDAGVLAVEFQVDTEFGALKAEKEVKI